MSIVEVYRNLNRKGLWFSFRSRETGLLLDRIDLKAGDTACLRNVTFNVSKAGRERVLREKRKNVHALIRGEPWPMPFMPIFAVRYKHLKPHRVTYDPYKSPHFIGVPESGNYEILREAEYVTFDKDGVTAWTKS